VRGHLAEFIGGENEVFYRVEVSAKGDLVTTVLDPPRSLDAEGAAIVRARQQASIAAKQLRESNALCPRKYDAVALPASLIGQEGWLVYLLASASPQERVLAGHHRLRVSADGRQLLEVTPLSRSCQVVDAAGDESQVGIMITQLIARVPFETHVLASLTYRVVVLVIAEKHTWAVLGGSIELFDPDRP